MGSALNASRSAHRTMNKWRVAVLAFLIAAPFLFLVGYGSYSLWMEGWSIWVGWAMLASMCLAYILGWQWQRAHKLLKIDFTPELHWTDRDKEAWKLVEARARAASKVNPDKLLQINYYSEVAQEMALELARFYHPNAQDPFSSLTVPEMLAVVELAAHDLAEMVDKYLPGGHLMTVQDWKRAKKASDWYQTASNIYWAISAVISPINTGLRYLASQVGVSRPLALLQQNLVLWFYTAFLQRLGTYLIDLNSGRLRVGAERYRQLLQSQNAVAETPPDGPIPTTEDDRTEVMAAEKGDKADAVRQVAIALLGQVKAGKSSLVNALLGEQRARTNVLPETREVTRYDLKVEGIPTHMAVLDTIGYGHTGPRQDQMPATQNAAQQADVLLLVMHARNAAREPDLQMMRQLKEWFDSRPDLKLPKVLGVLTHIDLLQPGMEWQPPYRWQKPSRTKEKQIAEAVASVRETLGDFLVGVVPVCTGEGKVYGVEEWLLPALSELLGEARAVAMLRVLRSEIDTGKIRKVFDQFLAAGKETARILWESATK
jgi:predicted GTPase